MLILMIAIIVIMCISISFLISNPQDSVFHIYHHLKPFTLRFICKIRYSICGTRPQCFFHSIAVPLVATTKPNHAEGRKNTKMFEEALWRDRRELLKHNFSLHLWNWNLIATWPTELHVALACGQKEPRPHLQLDRDDRRKWSMQYVLMLENGYSYCLVG